MCYAELTAGDGAYDEEGFGAVGNGWREGRVGGGERIVFGAGEEAKEGTALEGAVIADGAAEHGVLGLKGVENGARGDGGGDFDLDFGADAGESAEMGGQSNADHG